MIQSAVNRVRLKKIYLMAKYEHICVSVYVYASGISGIQTHNLNYSSNLLATYLIVLENRLFTHMHSLIAIIAPLPLRANIWKFMFRARDCARLKSKLIGSRRINVN